MEYLILVAATLLCSFYNRRFTHNSRILSYLIIFSYAVILMGLRFRVGIDTMNYMDAYNQIPSLNKLLKLDFGNSRFEPGYIFIGAICKEFTNHFWLMQLSMASITNTCIFIFIYRYCKNPFTGLILYYLFSFLYFNTEIIRESAAIGIFLLNYDNLEKKRWFRFYLFSIFSILFHYSAIIIWLFPLANLLKPNYIYILLCASIMAITPMVENINQFLSIASIATRVNQYVNEVDTLNLNFRLGQLIKSGFPSILAFVLIRKYKIQDNMENMILLQILFSMGTFAIPIIFLRLVNYTTLFVVITFANFISIKRVKAWLKIAVVCFIFCTQSYYYYTMYHRWIPYISILNPIKIYEREQLQFDFN